MFLGLRGWLITFVIDKCIKCVFLLFWYVLLLLIEKLLFCFFHTTHNTDYNYNAVIIIFSISIISRGEPEQKAREKNMCDILVLNISTLLSYGKALGLVKTQLHALVMANKMTEKK